LIKPAPNEILHTTSAADPSDWFRCAISSNRAEMAKSGSRLAEKNGPIPDGSATPHVREMQKDMKLMQSAGHSTCEMVGWLVSAGYQSVGNSAPAQELIARKQAWNIFLRQHLRH